MILIVDDEADLRFAIAYDFKRKGFQVLEAGNGKEAFEIVLRHHVDLVVTDIRMPGGDGVELLRSIKSRDPDLPVVIFITGYADLGLDDAYAMGASAVFAKPFDRNALLNAVNRALSSPEENWGKREFERVEASFNIRLRIPDLGLDTVGKVVDIGKGGMFVALDGDLPEETQVVDFSIEVDAGSLRLIAGNGVVRWIRPQALAGKQRGCGIEFQFLNESCRSEVIALVGELGRVRRSGTYIPST